MNRQIITAVLFAAVAITIGAWFDAVGWALFVASLIWIATQALEFQRLQRWSRRPLSAPENASAMWYQLANQPYRALLKERRRSKRFLGRAREVLSLVELIPDAVIVLGRSGEIEGYNEAAERLLHLKPSDRGISLASVVRSPDFVTFLRDGNEENLLEFASPFDADRSLEARSFSVDEQRYVVLVRDNTELNRLLTMRQNFIANVSHELRTPLTVVNGYLETITDASQPDDLRLALVDRLTSPLARIRSLVDDLLLLTRLESTPMPDHLDLIPMTQVINSAMLEVQGLASDDKQVTVNCASTHKVLGIEAELYSVCVNLLSNALRYSQDGAPVEISWCDVGDKVRLLVRDQGVGIAPEHLSRITERFYRVDMADSRTRGGTGLGLAIVKHVLRRHNSELRVKSVVGEGSEFYCDFDPAPTGAEALHA